MTERERNQRRTKAATLEVKHLTDDSFLVASSSDPDIFHKVTVNSVTSCTCQDWKHRHKDDPSFKCMHLFALEQQGKRTDILASSPECFDPIDTQEDNPDNLPWDSATESPGTLAQKIDRTNEILKVFGSAAIDTDQKGFTGYGFQYVIDAVNSALGPEGWRYELLTHQVEKSSEKAHKAFVLLQLRLDDGSWFTKGPQFGGSQNTDSTDALKGALSDGLKKAFSHWSVGNKAYRGELGGRS